MLGCVNGTNVEKAISDSKKIENNSWNYYPDILQMRGDLVDKKIDGFPAELPYAEYVVNNSSHLTVINEFITSK